jgi:uncharacterized protein (DUF427 family)
MKRFLASGLFGVLLFGGCVTTESSEPPQSKSTTPAIASQASATPADSVDETGCVSCATDPRPFDRGAPVVQASYLDDTNRLLPQGGPRWVPTPKRVRVYFGGQLIADSRNVHLLRESTVPAYYFPIADVKSNLFVASKTVRNSPVRGDASYSSIKVGDRVAEDAVWTYNTPVEGAGFLKGYVSFEWDKMDGFYEEKDPVFGHPRDPFLRIDTTHSSSNVKVILNGQTVADSNNSVILLEPGHPIRYYLPIADVKMEFLRPSETTSHCPYKGIANYYSMDVGGKLLEDVIWSYRAATFESDKISGMVSFYNEKVDKILIDGKELTKPLPRRRPGSTTN